LQTYPDSDRDEDGFRNRGSEVTRAEAFFDAAFAFAVTLMVISIDEIPDSAEKLINALKSVPAFAASFLLIVLFWNGHAEWSRRYGLNDRHSQRISLLLVFLMLIFIYPLRMVFGALFAWISGGWLPAQMALEVATDLRVTFIVFALAFGTLGAAMYALYRHAWSLRDRIGLDPSERIQTRFAMHRWALLPLIALMSLALSATLPYENVSDWVLALPGLVLFMVNILEVVLAYRMRKALRASQHPAPGKSVAAS
jgi:uncharacterized membrane protein